MGESPTSRVSRASPRSSRPKPDAIGYWMGYGGTQPYHVSAIARTLGRKPRRPASQGRLVVGCAEIRLNPARFKPLWMMGLRIMRRHTLPVR